MTEQTWYEQLNDCIENDPKIKELLLARIPKASLFDLKTGRKKDGGIRKIDDLNNGRRAFIYKVTGLEVFKPDNYVDPDTIDIREIISGNQPRSHLELFLGARGISNSSFASKAGVDSLTIKKYIQGEGLRDGSVKKIIIALSCYAPECSRPQTIPEAQTPQEQSTTDPQESILGQLAANIEGLRRDVRNLGATYNPTPQERIEIVTHAIEAMYEQLSDYFANADQEDRDALANAIDPHEWGLLVNVMGGIHKRAGSAETFGRRMISGGGIRRRRE